MIGSDLLRKYQVLRHDIVRESSNVSIDFFYREGSSIRLLFLTVLLPFYRRSLRSPRAYSILRRNSTTTSTTLINGLYLSNFLNGS